MQQPGNVLLGENALALDIQAVNARSTPSPHLDSTGCITDLFPAASLHSLVRTVCFYIVSQPQPL